MRARPETGADPGTTSAEGNGLTDGQGELRSRWSGLGLVRASQLGGGSPARPAPGRGHAALAAVPAPGTPVEPAGSPTPAAPSAPADPPAPVDTSPPIDTEAAGLLPVPAPLAGMLPAGGLRRGSTVAVGGSTALLLALIAEASRAGSWCALVGLPGLGLQAAAEAGLDLSRTALVPRPGTRPASVVAALVDGVDVVVLGGARQWRAADRQRLAARVRQRGAVLVPVVTAAGQWPGADAELWVSGGTWSGLQGSGAGRLRSRRVHLRCAARGRPDGLTDDLLLPAPGGGCAPAEPDLVPAPVPVPGAEVG